MSENNWSVWSKFVLAEIKRAHKEVEKQGEIIGEMKLEIAMLKVRAGLWGALAGAIPSLAVAIWLIIKNA